MVSLTCVGHLDLWQGPLAPRLLPPCLGFEQVASVPHFVSYLLKLT